MRLDLIYRDSALYIFNGDKLLIEKLISPWEFGLQDDPDSASLPSDIEETIAKALKEEAV